MKQTKRISKILRIGLMIVFALILIPILAVNMTLIIKGSINENVPPDVFGIAPLAVSTGSMEGNRDDSFSEGSLIFVRILKDGEKENLKTGDIVTFRTMGAYVTHRIVSLNRGEENELISVVTQGDANNVTDGAVPMENIVGQCVASIGGLGDFAMFLQTPAGILVFVGIPVVLFIVYDVLRITLYNRKVRAISGEENTKMLEEAQNELKDKDEEIARLRAMVEQKSMEEISGEKSADDNE